MAKFCIRLLHFLFLFFSHIIWIGGKNLNSTESTGCLLTHACSLVISVKWTQCKYGRLFLIQTHKVRFDAFSAINLQCQHITLALQHISADAIEPAPAQRIGQLLIFGAEIRISTKTQTTECLFSFFPSNFWSIRFVHVRVNETTCGSAEYGFVIDRRYQITTKWPASTAAGIQTQIFRSVVFFRYRPAQADVRKEKKEEKEKNKKMHVSPEPNTRRTYGYRSRSFTNCTHSPTVVCFVCARLAPLQHVIVDNRSSSGGGSGVGSGGGRNKPEDLAQLLELWCCCSSA